MLQPGLVSQVSYEPDREENSIAVIVRGMRAAWRLRIFAEGQPGSRKTGSVYVGSVRTLPWTGGDRVVAFACCPGATRWFVDGQPEDHAANEQPTIDFIGAPCCGVFGVAANPGISVDGARHIGTLAGVNGAVNVPGPLVGFSCKNGAAPGSVSVTQPGDLVATVIPLDPFDTYSDYYGALSGVVVGLVFTGTDSYSVTYEVPGDGLDRF